ITRQICQALAAAHGAGIIHRDIKPENVMIRRDGIVKVLDFGLAKVSEMNASHPGNAASSLTNPGMVMGTASYMSPEQARGQRVDARADIFSLGVMLYEMLAGQTPFQGESVYEVIAAILDREPAPLTRHAPDAPVQLEYIVNRMLRKDRAERYQSAGDLMNALCDYTEGKTFPNLTAGNKRRESHGVARAKTLFSARGSRKITTPLLLLTLLVTAAGIALYRRTPRLTDAISSIAVLPFTMQSQDSRTDYLADGIPESVINSLARASQLKVMSRNSSFRFRGAEIDARDVGRKLGVSAVLSGRITQRDEDLILGLELVDARDNRLIWGQQYNRRLVDVLAVQEEIANTVSEKLRLDLSGNERRQLAKQQTQNLRAYAYYLQGRVYTQRRSREDLQLAIHSYEKAIAEDAAYALAWAGLAEVFGSFVSFGLIEPMEGLRKAREAASRAVALDDNLGEAHAALGQTWVLVAPYDFPQAEREMRRAVDLSPGASMPHAMLSRMLVRQGRFDECLAEMMIARELDPLSAGIAANIAMIHYFRRDYPQAITLLRKSHELGPALTSPTEIGIYLANNALEEAITELEKARRTRGDDPVLLFSRGMIYAARGNRAETLRIAGDLETRSGAALTHALLIARIHASLGDPERALAWMERGFAAGAIGLFYKDDATWDSIRQNPRFVSLLRQMGVP
ncbi:MAG: protein kinase domain-containing protein, partial [Blastocatellia bacterium]